MRRKGKRSERKEERREEKRGEKKKERKKKERREIKGNAAAALELSASRLGHFLAF
jgi:hypothetical protein